MEFIGKLHPLLIHLPIGFILAAFGLELMFRKTENELALKSIRFLIGMTAFTAVLSAIFGYILSLESGYETDIIDTHFWLGVAFSTVAVLLYAFRSKLHGKRELWLLWTLVLCLLTATAHYGGSLTHGENYLAESAPSFLKGFLNEDEPTALNKPMDSIIVFEDMIQPIMERKCWYCHNTKKSKGRLNFETVAGWKKGGKAENLVVPGDVFESHLLQRVYLPMDDKKHMPPKGKAQLASAEIAILEWWIENGGDYEAKLPSLDRNQRMEMILERQIGDSKKAVELDLPDYDQNNLTELQNSGIKILPMAKESNLLEVRFRGDSLISDGDLNALLELSENIVRVDFSFSGITSKQLKSLTSFENLNYLSLAETAVDDTGLKHLTEMENLRVLNLHSTHVTIKCLPQLKSIKGLQKVFLFNTKIPLEALEKFATVRTGLKVVY